MADLLATGAQGIGIKQVVMMRKHIRQFIQLILWSGISVAAHADRTRFCSVLCFAERDPQAQQSYLVQISELYFNKTLRDPAFYRKDYLEKRFVSHIFSGAGHQVHDESIRYFQWEGGRCNYACPGDGHRVDSQEILLAVHGNRQRMRAFEIWMHSYAYFDEALSERAKAKSWDDLSICALQKEIAAKGYTLHADFDMPACLPFLAAKRPLHLPGQRYHPPHMHFLTISNSAGESLRIRVHKDPRQSYLCASYQVKPSEDCNISYHPHDHYLFAREFRIPIGLVVISGEYP